MPTALITGVAGQDGSYLAEFLLQKDYHVVGTTRDARRALELPYARALAGVELLEGDGSRVEDWTEILRRERPDEVYHLAGPSRVSTSFQDPAGTELGVSLPTFTLVQAILEELPSPRLFFAGSSEIFAAEPHAQDESATRDPASPYGRAKVDAMGAIEHAREKFGLYAVTGILFNHESPRRSESFVSRKIVRAAVRIAHGRQQRLTLGNIDVRRDWGFAGDYVRAMWLMLQQAQPNDYVVATGETHSVRELVEVAFGHAGLTWQDHVVQDERFFRPADPTELVGDASKARDLLGWEPTVGFEEIVARMVAADL